MRNRLLIFLASLLLLGITDLAYAYVSGQLNFQAAEKEAIVSTAPAKIKTQVVETQAESTSTKTVLANAKLVRVVDGDTMVVRFDNEDKDSKIRLLGINTPEVVDPRRPVECFGKAASGKMHELVDGKRIRLEEDPQADERDKYDRLLRNVILEDGTDVNALMIREGYAYAYLSFPLDAKRKAQLKKLEQDAKMAQRGLWDPKACNGNK